MSVGGPFFDDLEVGQRFEAAPGLTLTAGAAAVHQAIVGDRLRLALDAELCGRVTGEDGVLAHPALVWDVAIGQSTLATHRVIANLFYRGLVLRRAPRIGDTLSTVTEVVALRETTRRPDRPPTGLAVLRITTVDQAGRAVLDFWRCAMLPLRDTDAATGHADSFDAIPDELADDDLRLGWDGWSLDALTPSPHVVAGESWEPEGGDVVTSAPELARLSLNVAMAHHDRTVNDSGRRLVYGGHTIGIAAAQTTRVLPDLATIVGWHGCDHLAPVYEGDLLRSRLAVEEREGNLVHLRSEVEAEREDGSRAAVLDWRFVAVVA
jgi:acyl dehydratase